MSAKETFEELGWYLDIETNDEQVVYSKNKFDNDMFGFIGAKTITFDKEMESLEIKYSLPENLTAPLNKDSEVGKIEVFLNKDLLFSEKVYTIDDIKSKTLWQRLKEFAERW